MDYQRAELTITIFSVDDIITTSDLMPDEMTQTFTASGTIYHPKVIIATIPT